ncbi:MAG: hypothetical protein M0R17_01290 [Candidatus Omnitrophica bacterium]|jgi:hypothetical protein|nr:hypothetical protein [Candidatus Omnitrophota bacterium]
MMKHLTRSQLEALSTPTLLAYKRDRIPSKIINKTDVSMYETHCHIKEILTIRKQVNLEEIDSCHLN